MDDELASDVKRSSISLLSSIRESPLVHKNGDLKLWLIISMTQPIFISRGRDLVLHPLDDLLQLCEYCSLVAVS